MKVFQKNLMASEDVKAYLGSGVSTTIAFNDGDAVKVGDLASTSDVNVRTLTYGGADCDAIVDYVGVSHGQIQGVTYKEGVKTAGLSAEVGELVRYRKPVVGDSFWLAKGNTVGTVVVGTSYLSPTVTDSGAGTTADGTWTVAASPAATSMSLKVEASKNLITGTRNADVLYFCTVVKV